MQERRITKEHKHLWRGEGYVCYLNYGGSISAYMSKLIKFYTVNMCSLMYIKYASIKLLEKRTEQFNKMKTFYLVCVFFFFWFLIIDCKLQKSRDMVCLALGPVGLGVLMTAFE